MTTNAPDIIRTLCRVCGSDIVNSASADAEQDCICTRCARDAYLKEQALEDHRREAERKQRAREDYWLSICPPIYCDTNWGSGCELPKPIIRLAKEWEPQGDFHSLGLFGTSGCGKTRAAFEILRRNHIAGKDVFAVHASDAWDSGYEIRGLATATRHQFSNNPDLAAAAFNCLHATRDADVLLIDDIGQERAGAGKTVSGAIAESLFGVLEFRMIHRRPTIWTTNLTGPELIERLGRDRGEALMRRLKEVYLIPTL